MEKCGRRFITRHPQLWLPLFLDTGTERLKVKFNWDSSTLFPINNIGVVCLSALIGFLLFKETFSVRKLVGFLLAVASIVIIGFLN